MLQEVRVMAYLRVSRSTLLRRVLRLKAIRDFVVRTLVAVVVVVQECELYCQFLEEFGFCETNYSKTNCYISYYYVYVTTNQ